MNLEVASYIAGIIAAAAGIGSLYYAREQHRKHKLNSGHNVLASAAPVSVGEFAREKKSAAIAVEFSSDGIPKEFLIAFETTKGMFNKPARDIGLQALIQKTLAANRTEFAIAIAFEIWNKPTRDEALAIIVQHALRQSEFQLAHQASELFFNMVKKDRAKRLITDWAGDQRPNSSVNTDAAR